MKRLITEHLQVWVNSRTQFTCVSHLGDQAFFHITWIDPESDAIIMVPDPFGGGGETPVSGLMSLLVGYSGLRSLALLGGTQVSDPRSLPGGIPVWHLGDGGPPARIGVPQPGLGTPYHMQPGRMYRAGVYALCPCRKTFLFKSKYCRVSIIFKLQHY